MNSLSSALTLLLVSAVAAHSAQDIFARPHIAKKLTAMGEDDKDYPCEVQFNDLIECVGGWKGDCVTCFIDLYKTLEEDTTCAELEAGSFCVDIDTCMTGPCADPDCGDKLMAFEECEAQVEIEDEEEDCPGLCEAGEAKEEPPVDAHECNLSTDAASIRVLAADTSSSDDIACPADTTGLCAQCSCSGPGACLLCDDNGVGSAFTCEIDPDYFTSAEDCANDVGIWCENEDANNDLDANAPVWGKLFSSAKPKRNLR